MPDIIWHSHREVLPRVNPHIFVLVPDINGQPIAVHAARVHNDANIVRWAPMPVGRPMLLNAAFRPVFDKIAEKMREEGADRAAIRFDLMPAGEATRWVRPRGVRLYCGNESVNKLRQFTVSLELCRFLKKFRNGSFVEALSWTCSGRPRFSLFMTLEGHMAILDGEEIHPLRMSEEESGHDAIAWAEAFIP